MLLFKYLYSFKPLRVAGKVVVRWFRTRRLVSAMQRLVLDPSSTSSNACNHAGGLRRPHSTELA